MKCRYITLSNKQRYLIHTLSRIAPSQDVNPNDYNSFIPAAEVYESDKVFRLPNAAVGYVKGGTYSGLSGNFTDANGNRYHIEYSNGTLTYATYAKNGGEATRTYSGDCVLFFSSSFPTTGQSDFGLSCGHPWTDGSYSDLAPSLAYALFDSEGKYNGFIGEFGERAIKNIGYVDSSYSWKCTRSDTQSATYFGVCFPFPTIDGATLPIGTGTNGINIDDSTSDYDEDEDPYNDDDESGGGGGGGNHDDTSDPQDFPSLPVISAVDTGFITLYNPSIAQLKALAQYMWSGLFDLDTYRKLFADPMSAILGLSIVPVNVPSGGSQNVTIGNIQTNVSMTKASSQYVEVDCGSINVEEYWGSYLDYDPFTKMELYLPFIGTHQVSTDDLMKKTVHIKYHVDVLSGACCAYVKCGDSVLYSFEGQCSCQIPVTNSDWSSTISAAISAATAIGSLVATSGASAPALAAEGAATGSVLNYGKIIQAGGDMAASAMNVLKPSIGKSGGLSGMGGILGIQKPYLIITRPRQAVPSNQNKYQGYPSFVTKNLSELSGYTEVDSVILNNIPASDAELSEIAALLQEGVLL